MAHPGRPRFVLASASPRRLDLLRQIGFEPDLVAPATVDESPRRGELPRALAARLAGDKARRVATDHPGCVVLGADTVVALGRRGLPKATDEAQARRCLELLSGRRHTVHTAIAVIDGDGRERCRVAATKVRFKRLDAQEIANYLASEEWRGKAGGYAIQGRAGALIPWINGGYGTVVGLPLHETAMLLAAAGLSAT